MTIRDPFTVLLDAEALGRWGHRALWAGFALSLLIVVFAIWQVPSALPVLAILPVGAALAVWLFRRPLVNLGCVMAAFVLVLERNAGFSAVEVLFGLYFSGYLAHWYATRLLLYRERIAQTVEDYALLVFAGVVLFTVPFAVLYGAPVSLLVSELIALSTMAFYFPVREACIRYPKGVWVVVGALVLIALFAAARNAYLLRLGLSNAEFAWQVATGRVVTNDYILMAISMLTLCLSIFASTRRQWATWLPLFLIVFGGLLITQSRGFWLTFALASGVMFVMVRGRYKTRLVVLGVVGLGAVALIGLLLFADLFTLYVAGMADRLFSVESAATADLSLVNRWYESAAVWQMIKANPILGYGPAIVYPFFDRTISLTDPDSFVHNGYLQFWFKFGIVGLAAMVVFLVGTMIRGFALFRQAQAPRDARVLGLAVALIMVGTLPATITNNPFFLIDSLFMIGALAGVCAGMNQRARLQAA